MFKSKSYLMFLGSQPCCITGTTNNVDLHHESLLRKFSGGRKNKFDFGALPLDHGIHLYQRHSWGKEKFWEHYNKNPYEIAERLISRYIDTHPEDIELAENALEMIRDERTRRNPSHTST
ncbi:MAG: hypothetical protein WC965_01750 [Thiohalomonadaceae bacterium]